MTQYEHILCAMGVEGFPSRVLASYTNSYLTYVSPIELMENTNTIGHIDPVTINELYRFKSISKDTNLVYTVPVVLFIVLRYLLLVFKGEKEADPTSMILSDKTLLIAGLICGLMMFFMLYGTRIFR